MDADTYSNDDVIAKSNENFVNLKLHSKHQAGDVAKFKSAYRGGFPATFILDSEGTILMKMVGYRDAAGYLGSLDKVLKHYPAYKDGQAKLAENPDDPAAHEALGDTYYEWEIWDKAKDHLSKVVEAQPDNASANFKYGKALADGEHEKAKPYFEKTIELDKDGSLGLADDAAYELVAADMSIVFTAAQKARKNPTADQLTPIREKLEKLLTDYPETDKKQDIWFGIGIAKFYSEDPVGADEAFKAAEEIDPESILGKRCTQAREQIAPQVKEAQKADGENEEPKDQPMKEKQEEKPAKVVPAEKMEKKMEEKKGKDF